MQVLKEELREAILQAAEYEFLKHGYKDTSMRMIAKRAHTTLGNVYNYFQGKDALFEALVGELPEAIHKLIDEHEEQELYGGEITEIEELSKLLDGADYRQMGQDVFLSKRFVILLEGAKGTPYENYRKQFLEVIKGHLISHVGQKEGLANILSHSFLEAILFVAKTYSNLDEGKEELIKYLKIFIHGIVSFQK